MSSSGNENKTFRPSFERILITNDDGINASGIKHLKALADKLSNDVWVVAPMSEQSGAGHSLSLTKPLRVRNIGEKTFGVEGTPTDCVMMALNKLITGKRPTLVLSGVNAGVNLAEDVTYSGTVAGAMEGALAGLPSIALSQERMKETRKGNWEVFLHHGERVIRALVNEGWPSNTFMNINFPSCEISDVLGVAVTEQGWRNLNELEVQKHHDPRGYPYYWFGLTRGSEFPDDGTDLKAIADKIISISPLHLQLTHFETRDRLKVVLDETF
jgi:5'-nucleotidase